MITCTFGPWFGPPDGSPFVIKAMMLLKMAGLTYVGDRNGLLHAPKGKLPFLDGDGREDRGFHADPAGCPNDFDAGLSGERKALGRAVEKMCDRWLDDANFARRPAHFFDAAPAPARAGAASAARVGASESAPGRPGPGRPRAAHRRRAGGAGAPRRGEPGRF
jgi:hypothetical protein